MKTNRFLLAVIPYFILLAICFYISLMLSCSFFDKSKSDDDDEQSSSSSIRSSSSVLKSSSGGEVEPGGNSSSDDDDASSSSIKLGSSSSAISSSSSDEEEEDDSSSSTISTASSSSDDEEDDSSSSVASSSSSSSSSSSAKAGSSSSKSLIVYSDSVTYKDEAYPTVKIGTQIWMAKNLNYAVEGSKCWGEGVTGVSADSSAKNCAKYGRLYDWATAMDLPPRCNTSSCAYLTDTTQHQGICPDGWHIPSNADWNALAKYINPSCTDNASCAEAGIRLMSVGGWGNGKDGHNTYGFAALPSGYCATGTSSTCYDMGSSGSGEGYWWSTTEYNSSSVYNRYVTAGSSSLYNTNYLKTYYYSIRCVKDN